MCGVYTVYKCVCVIVCVLTICLNYNFVLKYAKNVK